MQSKTLPTTYFIWKSKEAKYIFRNNKTEYIFHHIDKQWAGGYKENYIETITSINSPNVRYLSKKEVVLYKLLGYI